MSDLLINIDVDDLDKAVAFYQRIMDVHVGRYLEDWGVELLGASSPIFLLLKDAGTKPSPNADDIRRYRRHWSPVHLDVVVTEIDAAVSDAVQAGATLEGEVRTHSWGRIASLADPFGHGLCLVEFLGRGYDEIAG